MYAAFAEKSSKDMETTHILQKLKGNAVTNAIGKLSFLLALQQCTRKTLILDLTKNQKFDMIDMSIKLSKGNNENDNRRES